MGWLVEMTSIFGMGLNHQPDNIDIFQDHLLWKRFSGRPWPNIHADSLQNQRNSRQNLKNSALNFWVLVKIPGKIPKSSKFPSKFHSKSHLFSEFHWILKDSPPSSWDARPFGPSSGPWPDTLKTQWESRGRDPNELSWVFWERPLVLVKRCEGVQVVVQGQN